MPAGGFRVGAGRPSRHRSIATARKLAIGQIGRCADLVEPRRTIWGWDDGSAISLTIARDAVTTLYSYLDAEFGRRSVDVRIQIGGTACHFGGIRSWFICPACTRRVANIYLCTIPRCRRCEHLVYLSQREHKIDRVERRIRRVLAKLRAENLAGAISRPPRMWRRTYLRLRTLLASDIMVREELFEEILERCPI